MSKEIRLGPRPYNEWDRERGNIFENVIHIPEEDDIAVIYGPNRSGKSTMIRAIENTMDILQLEGWDDQIGIDPPYTLKFIDETKLSDNIIDARGINYAEKDEELETIIDTLEKKGALSKRNLWAYNILMINCDVLDRNAYFLPKGVDWVHYKGLEEDEEMEHLFIDLRRCRIRTVAQLEVGSEHYPIEKDGFVTVELGGVNWPMFWPNGSPGWVRLDNQSSKTDYKELSNIILEFYSNNIPKPAFLHYSSNPNESVAMRRLLDKIFDKNKFADSPGTLAKLSRRDIKLRDRTKKELVAILMMLDDIFTSHKIMNVAVNEWLHECDFDGDFSEREILETYLPGKKGGNKDELLEEITLRFRAVLFHRLEPEEDDRPETSGYGEPSTGHYWSVETEVLFPDMSEEESRDMVRGMFGIYDPFTSDSIKYDERVHLLKAIRTGRLDEEVEEGEDEGGLSFLMRHPDEVEPDEKQEVFMALKELLPQRFSFRSGRYYFPQTTYGGPLFQNGFLTIFIVFRTLFRKHCNLIWWEKFASRNSVFTSPAIRRYGTRDAAMIGENSFPRSLTLDVDRVSGSMMSSPEPRISPRNPNLALQASKGLKEKIHEFSRALPQMEDVVKITEAMDGLIANAKAEAINGAPSSKKWYVCAADNVTLQYQWPREFCFPRNPSDQEMNLTDILKKADDLLDRGLIEYHSGVVDKIISVYEKIKVGEASPEEREEDKQKGLYLRQKAKWGEYEGTEIDLIYEFQSLINKLWCSLAFIQAASEITRIRLKVAKDGECEFHTSEDQEQILSSGEQHVFAMLVPMATLVLQQWGKPETQIVMIDEPEVSLHVKWQRELYDSLSSILKEIREIPGSARVKAILSTHSPEFIGSHEGTTQRLGPKEAEYES